MSVFVFLEWQSENFVVSLRDIFQHSTALYFQNE